MILRTCAAIFAIPMLALALEPSNPTTFCNRFIGDADIQNCEAKMKDDNSDWYAATVCQMQNDDTAFWDCWKKIQGKSFNPQALQKCADEELADVDRGLCLDKAQTTSGRAPASAPDLFQPLKSRTPAKKR